MTFLVCEPLQIANYADFAQFRVKLWGSCEDSERCPGNLMQRSSERILNE